MNRMLKGWRQTRRGEQFRAHLVNYADDFVILSRGKAKEALEWTRGVLERLDLSLNEKKTSIRNARQERFDFLGIHSGRTLIRGTGESTSDTVREQERGRIKQKAGELWSAERSTVGGCLSAAESEVARLAAVLPLREQGPGV